jgi:hypothetical protein
VAATTINTAGGSHERHPPPVVRRSHTASHPFSGGTLRSLQSPAADREADVSRARLAGGPGHLEPPPTRDTLGRRIDSECMRLPDRARAGALLLGCFLSAGVAAPVAHQAWHRPDHVHGPADRRAGPEARHEHGAVGAVAHRHEPVRRLASTGSRPHDDDRRAAPESHSHPYRHSHVRLHHSHPSSDGAGDTAPDALPPAAPRPATGSNVPGEAPGAGAGRPPSRHVPAPPDGGQDTDHGRGSIAHLALAMLDAPAAVPMVAPAEAVAAPPEPVYTSCRRLVVPPRPSRAPPA